MRIKMLKYVAFALIACVLFTATAIGVYTKLFPEIEIKTASCYGFKSYDFSVGNIRVREFDRNFDQQLTFVPKNEKKLIELICSSEYYISKYETVSLGAKINGYLFCKDNCSYVLYKFNDDIYKFEALYSEFSIDLDNGAGDYDRLELIYSSPMGMLSYSYIGTDGSRRISPESELKKFFDFSSYHDAKQYYATYSEDFVYLDDLNQQILLRAYDNYNKKNTVEKSIILDFARKDIGYICDDGAILWVSEFGEL